MRWKEGVFMRESLKQTEFRDLDGVYFRLERDGKWHNICFSDLTEKEMDKVMSGRNEAWLRSLCKILGKTLRDIGDQLDLVITREDEEE